MGVSIPRSVMQDALEPTKSQEVSEGKSLSECLAPLDSERTKQPSLLGEKAAHP
jgi:hypothetical protein